MTVRKTKPIVRRNIIVWPLIPRLTRGVNLARQRGNQFTANVVILPVIHIEGKRAKRHRPNWMDHVHLKPNNIGVVRATMRNQRISRRKYYEAQERLREIFSKPA